MKTIKQFILFLFVCGVFVNSGTAWAMEKGLSENNTMIVDKTYALIEKNKLKEAEKLLQTAFKTQPDNYELHMLMAEIMEKKQDWSGAIKYLTLVIEAYPNDAYAIASRGFAILNQGNPNLALRDLERSQETGKLTEEAAQNVAAAIAEIQASHYVGQSGNFSLSEDLWEKAEYYSEKENVSLALKYGRESAELLPDNRDRNLQMAYLALKHEQDREAVTYFEKAFALGEPAAQESSMLADVAYTYKRLGENEKSLNYLEKVIEATNRELAAGNATQEAIENNYNLRREHADLIREFGSNTGIYYTRMNDNGYALQGIQEFFWQPYNKNGKQLQLFVMGIGTLSSNIYKDGVDTSYVIGGFSVKPFTDYNLLLGADRVFKIGKYSEENDTRLRIAHSWDIGSELKPATSNWLYTTLFQEYLYAIENDYSIYSGEARVGRSFKIADRLVVSPHAFVSANYNSRNNIIISGGYNWDVYAGPGIHFRRWYREDKLNAPKSYLDLIIQYRAAITSRSDSMLYVILSNSF